MFTYGQREVTYDDMKYDQFIRRVQQLYNHKQNAYHNFKHGVTVMQGVYYFIRYTPFDVITTELQKFAMLFAGLMHDIDHSGKSNSYEMNSMSGLAIRYNDKSILGKTIVN